MKIYCPRCGEWTVSDIIEISPGAFRWDCPECGAEFDIDIGYIQLFEHNFRSRDK